MTFKKPCRICNKTVLGIQDQSHAVNATLKVAKGRYELRIRIPDSRKTKYSVVIVDGMLYVYEGNKTMSDSSKIFVCFLLPANVQQNKVQALYRNYGLKVVMPMRPHNTTALQVPILREIPQAK